MQDYNALPLDQLRTLHREVGALIAQRRHEALESEAADRRARLQRRRSRGEKEESFRIEFAEISRSEHSRTHLVRSGQASQVAEAQVGRRALTRGVCGRFCLIRASRFLEGRMHSVRPSLFDWSEQQPTRNLLRTISSLIEHQSHCGGIEHSHSGILALPWVCEEKGDIAQTQGCSWQLSRQFLAWS
jgi:hypothetical protein